MCIYPITTYVYTKEPIPLCIIANTSSPMRKIGSCVVKQRLFAQFFLVETSGTPLEELCVQRKRKICLELQLRHLKQYDKGVYDLPMNRSTWGKAESKREQRTS